MGSIASDIPRHQPSKQQTAGAQMRAMRWEAGLFAFASSVAAALAEANHAPPDTVWILSAAAGTMMGAFASTLTYANLSHGQRAARIAVSFCAGLLAAPYAAEQIPRPESVPLVLHVFSVSGLCAFVAWSFVRAAQKRMGGIADSLIDRVSTPKQARRDRDEHEDGGP